jgi:hypothetical protein
MSNAAASQDRCRQRSSDDGTEVDRTAPLAVALLRAGLSEQQIVVDNWTALLSLPQDAVDATMAAPEMLTRADKAALEQHATLDVLKVTPSSPLSCEMWFRVVSRFAAVDSGRQLVGVSELFDTLVVMSSDSMMSSETPPHLMMSERHHRIS